MLTYDHIEASNVIQIAKELTNTKLPTDIEFVFLFSGLLKAVCLIDLTTLAGDDTPANVQRLCVKAAHPLSECVLNKIENAFRTAAVCVYPYQVKTCAETFKKLKLPNFNIASVATGFPTGQYPLETRLLEIKSAINDGANEIDVVINRTLALQGDWEGVYNEVCAMRKACGDQTHLKTILATGELSSYDNVYKASMVCMLAGADFIKTSTGKETVNATLPVSLVMARAIQDFKEVYGIKIGFKPAGGLRTAKDAIDYLQLIDNVLGSDWTNPDYLRFGASSLLANVETRLYSLCHNGLMPLPGELDFF
ncbi:LOW QUALITY PROTEIN: deoxyribose-phosphate aldolase [Schistosoma mansoni]|uniref:deoxyribose-phosphate aldolase n=1 Tax=Schistosoma mansoni TaxID=6183 RepID=UPI00022DBF34|nr:LOW QUALITY PROTEIN: deoxyribose-phosphate aldolase [Schistosoma mansoni]|eukprot:XP_018653149.1 LOW QUALITY PROTEIN: deoxyribose-phosphate aldolase [Schistosoma mansoni]